MAKLRHFDLRSKLRKLQNQCQLYYPIRCTDLRLYKLFSVGAYFYAPKVTLKVIYFKKYSDSSSDLFMKHKILNAYQLHIYELLKFKKFVLKSLSKLHQEPQLNDITRSSAKPMLNEPICRRQIENRAIKARDTKLFNSFSNADLFPEDIVCGCVYKIINFYQFQRNLFNQQR